jgi:phosphoribosylformylglycinamidine synthase
MTEACTVLEYPVVSGNVSLYNETNGEGIYPTPAIGGVGLIKDIAKTKTIAFKQSDSLVFVIGETKGHLGNSQFLSIIQNKELGSTPIINLDNELKNGKFTLELINQNLALSTHDIGEGGLLIAAAEMSLSSNIGILINSERKNHEYFFGEDQSRYLIEIDKKNEEALNKLAREHNVKVECIGHTAEENIEIKDIGKISIHALKTSHEDWFQNFTK